MSTRFKSRFLNIGFSAIAGSMLSAGLASSAHAAAPTLQQTYGNWINVVGGTDIVTQTVGSENQVRWGTPATADGKSGLGFLGETFAPPLDTSAGQFKVGTLTHYNYPIFSGGTPSSLDLDLSLDFGSGLVAQFDYTLTIDETPNTAPCAYTGITICPDKVMVSPVPNQSFAYMGNNYIVETFFRDSSGNRTNFVITEEAQATPIDLWGLVTQVPNPPSSVPGPLPLFGAAAAFGYSRRLRKRLAGTRV